jgi:hypothetical protein
MNINSVLEKILGSAGFTIRSLEATSDVIYVLDRHDRIEYCNAAWDMFAFRNKGRKLEREKIVGSYCLHGVPDFLRKFYEHAYHGVLCTQKPWEHDYECSSPTKYRLFHMRVLPLNRSHLLIENSLLVERAHRRKSPVKVDEEYINRHGWIIMCAHCRRTEHLDLEGKRQWRWVPSYLVTPPAPVSHGMCPTCISYYLKVPPKLN